MFEQTLLTHPASARKTGALAASFVAQSAIVGVLIVGPLLYTQTLPMVPVFMGEVLTISHPPPPPPPPPEKRTVATSNASAARGMARPFVPPTRVPTGPIRTTPADVAIEAVEVVLAVGVPTIASATITALPGLIPAPAAVVTTQPATVVPPVEAAKPIRVSGGVLAAKLIKQVLPKYPVLAKQIRVSGTVHLLATVAKDGRIGSLRTIDGHPMLIQAAREAVLQWVYSPTILNGAPVEVEAPIEVNFTLN